MYFYNYLSALYPIFTSTFNVKRSKLCTEKKMTNYESFCMKII